MTGPGRIARQRGTAVITAMLIVTIATVLAVEIAWKTNLDLRRTEGLLGRDQASQFGLGAEAFATRLLEDKLQNQAGETAAYSRTDDEAACNMGFSFTLDQGGMTGGLCDLQGRFNLNNLVGTGGQRDEVAVKQFQRLIEAVSNLNELSIASDVAVIVESTVDWIDPDSNAEYSGAEDDYYTSEQPPYRAANFWFTSVSEFRSVRGVTPEIYAALSPYLAALPVSGGPSPHTRINVNTASVPVLMSLGDNISAVNAEQWIDESREAAFSDGTSFTEFVDALVIQSYVGYSSDYFELKGLISIGTTRLGMYSLLEYSGQKVIPRLRQFDVIDTIESATEPETDDQQVAAKDDE